MTVNRQQLIDCLGICDLHDIGSTFHIHNDAHDHDGEDRADRTKGNQTKAVIVGAFSTEYCCKTDPQRHDKWYRNGASGHASGVKGNSDKIIWDEES